MNPDTDQNIKLPEDLQRKFSVLAGRLRLVDTAIAVCGALAGLIISYMLVFVSDRFWDTPAWLRGVFMVAGVGVALYFVLGWIKLWVWKRRDNRDLANVVQAHHRRLGDRLLGIVELADPKARPANVSMALCRAAIAQVSAEALKFDFREAVASRKSKVFFLVAVFLVALVVTPSLLVPAASWNALARWLGPMRTTERFTFVSLDRLPERLVVPHGEEFEILCSVDFHPLWKSARARARYAGQPPVEGEIDSGQVLFRIPGQTEPGLLSLRVGDVSREISVEPRFRPVLKEMMARVDLPAYLQRPEPDEQVVRNASLSFLEGSTAVLRGKADRDLEEAGMELKREASSDAAALGVEDDWFKTARVDLDGVQQADFFWRSGDGLTNLPVWSLALKHRADAAPEALCPNQAPAVAMLVDEVLEIPTVARDDYGLKELGIWWQCVEREGTNILAQREAQLVEGSPHSTNLLFTFRFSPGLLGLPEQTVVTLHAVARDYLPEREATYSAPYEIYILGNEEHARLVQEQFEKLLAEVEEVTRRQEALLEESKQVAGMPASEQKSEEAAEKLAEQAAEQRDIAEATEQLARKGAETIREALRNKEIPTELLQEWTRQVESMQNLSQEQMPQASQSLSSAGQNPEQREQKTKEAVEKEEEILEKLQEMQNRMSSALDQMLANTLAQRLRKISKFENEVRDSIRSMLPETLGVSRDELSAQHVGTNERMAAGQEESGKETQALQEEITRFHDRTSVTNYGRVSEEMQSTAVVEGLNETVRLLRRNIAAQAMTDAARYAGKFEEWAVLLEAANKEEKEDKPGEPGEGEGEMSEEGLKRLLALLRTRQSEVNLRQHTEVLDQVKEGRGSYREDSIILSVRQSLVVDDVKALQEQDEGKFLGAARKSMEEAGNILAQPNTGAPAVAAETDAVNLLEAEILSMMQEQEGQGQGAAMAMLMQMMGMGQGQGNTGGGNVSGGTTDKPSVNPEGKADGAASLPREVEKAGGAAGRPVPIEYREALQNYHKSIEQLNR